MQALIFTLLFPLIMFSQETILIGDVDCSGEVNSEDAALILQFITNIIESLPCEENMTGLTPNQLQEMINMMDQQLNINYDGNTSNSNYPIMISNESSEALIFTDAMNYCYNLEENGYTDWYLPSIEELTYAASGGVQFPDEKTENNLWSRTVSHNNPSYPYLITIRLIAPTYNAIGLDGGNSDGMGSGYTRCIRHGINENNENASNIATTTSNNNSEQPITMIGPMYRYEDFSDFENYAVIVNNDIGIEGYLHYFDAVKFCAQLIYEEYDDWFLPSLKQIQDYIMDNPLNEIAIPNNNEGGKNFWAFMNFHNMNLMSDYDNYATTIHITGTDSSYPNQVFKIDDEWAEGYSRCFCVR